MPRNLRDISEHQGDPDLAYIQRKLSLAGDMALAIRRFLVQFDDIYGYVPVDIRKRKKQLLRALEDYMNCEVER